MYIFKYNADEVVSINHFPTQESNRIFRVCKSSFSVFGHMPCDFEEWYFCNFKAGFEHLTYPGSLKMLKQEAVA